MKKKGPIRVKKVDLPQMWNGGLFNQDMTQQGGSEGQGGGMGFGNMLSQAASAIPEAQQQAPPSNDYGVTFEGDTGPAKGAADTVKGIKTVFSAIPVWGQAVAAGMAIGDKIGGGTKDEFGIYKNKGSEVVSNIFSPTTQVSNIMDNLRDPSWEGVANMATLGIVGKTGRQRELERLKKRYEFDVASRGASQNEQAGNVIKNSLPVYQAPRYGKEGMKLSPSRTYVSKFTKFK
jgi:hypothetical protein